MPTSFSASGSNLSTDITVTAPSGFEVSTSSGSGYSSSLTLTQSSGTVSATTIYVRLAAADSAGSYSGNAVLSSTGATTMNVAIPACTVVSPFTTGNLAVVQLATSATSSTFSITELSPSTASQAAPVNSYLIPSSGSTALRQSNAGSTGRMSLSNDGTLLAFTGFEDPTGVTDETSITLRGVASLSSSYAYALQASYTSPAGLGDQIRGATFNSGTWYMSDKNGIWLNGAASAANSTNVRALKSFGGTVYVQSANATAVVSTVSADGTTLTGLPGLPGDANSVDFYMLSSGTNGSAFDLLYVLDGANITKYSLVGSTWMANGSATAIGVTGDGFCAAGNGAGASLFVTTGATNTVVKITDATGYNVAPSITTTDNVTLYTAASGFLKGIAFAPTATALPDLTVSVASPAIAVTGSNFDYTLTVANSGTVSATGVAVQFTLPAGLTFVSAADTGSGGFTGVNSSGVVTFSGGTLNAGASETLTVTVSAALSNTYAAAAGAAVIDPSSTIAESNENNNSSPIAASTVVGSYADLTVDVSGPATAAASSNFSYSLHVQNIGNADAAAVPVQFTLPAGLTFVSASDNGSNGFSGSNSSGVVTFTGGTLAQGASDTLTVTVSSALAATYNVPAGAAVINPSQTVVERNFANNPSVSTVNTLVTAPDLRVICVHNGSFAPGDTADTYSIYVTNNGNSSTDGSTVTISMTLPTGLTPTAADTGTINGWTLSSSGQTVNATRSDALATGASYPVLTVTVAVDSAASGPLSAAVNVTGGGDVSTGNNSITGMVNVGTPTPLTSAGNLIVSRSVYTGDSSTVPFPGTLPNGTASVIDGTYPSVWGNESPDPAFGVTSPIYLDQITTSGTVVSTVPLTSVVSSQLGLDVSTSFPSKSELALNRTPDSTGLTFMCYLAAANSLDASNTDTPYHIDPTNPITGIGTRQRAIVQWDYLGNVQVTPVNSYSGNNGRAAVLAGGYYFTVGNAGNGSGSATVLSLLSDDTGLQMIAPGAGGTAQAVGTIFGTSGTSSGYQHGFSLANVSGFAADKTGKDMNLRGLTVNPFTNTLFVAKGSGGNGVNTVYQVGTGGIPTPGNVTSTTFTIPPGFSQTSAASGKDGSGNAQTIYYPFGMWFADANTLYVGDEGVPTSVPTTYDAGSGQFTSALPANNPTAGLQKWVFDGSQWNLVYTLIDGLNLGQPYTVPDYPTGNNPATSLPWSPANNGLRNITGKVNGDGTVTIYAVTSTVSGGTDQGADPNQLVAITDVVAASTPPSTASFSILKTAGNKEVLRGVSFAPVAAPSLAVAGTLSAVDTTYGTASVSPSSFTVSGSDLTAGVTVTPPMGYEVSSDGATYGGNGAAITVGSAGSLASTTVYVRLAADATVAGSPYSGNITLTSGLATTQTMATAASTVSAKSLTISGLSGANKVYDSTTTASLSGSAALSGVLTGDAANVTLGGTSSALFASAAVANGVAITVTGYTISGSASANYTVTQPTGLTANITAVSLTITGVTANNKPYSGTTAATLSGTAMYVGLVSGETFTVTGAPAATFASAAMGTGIGVTVTGYTAPSSNYTVTQPTGLTANITAVPLTITGVTANNKPYSGTTSATLSGTAMYVGLVNGEAFTVTGTPVATFASAAMGTGIGVTVTGYTAPSANYTVTQPSGLTANITSAETTKPVVTITSPAASATLITTATTVTVTGTVADKDGVASVQISTNGGTTYTSATLGTVMTTSTGVSVPWSFTLTPTDGSNSIVAKATNVGNLTSTPTSARTFTYHLGGTLTVNRSVPTEQAATPDAVGNVTATGATLTTGTNVNPKTAVVQIGNTVTLTPTAMTGFKFGGWTGSSGTTLTPGTGDAVSFTMAANVTVTATWTSASPTALISTPAAGAKFITTATTVTVTGTASATNAVQSVRVSLDGGTTFTTATTTASGKTATWTATVNPAEGINHVQAQVTDVDGTTGALTIVRPFTYHLASTLTVTRSVPSAQVATPDNVGTLTVIGATLAPSAANTITKTATVQLGNPVKLTETPKAGYLFNGWTFSPSVVPTASTATSVSFNMVAGLTVTANWVVNPYVEGAGSYVGLVSAHSGTAPSNSTEGQLKMTLTNTGSFTGTLSLDGGSYALTGAFDVTQAASFGTAKNSTVTIDRSASTRSNLVLSLFSYSNASGDQITGTVTNGSNVCDVTIQKALYSSTNHAPSGLLNVTSSNSGYFTLAIDPTAATPATSYPQGYGYATIALTSAGVVTVTGTLADGTAISSTSNLVAGNNCPVFAQVLTPGSTTLKGGSFGGTLMFNVQTDSDVTGTAFQWFRPEVTGTAPATDLYSAGWPAGINVDAVGAEYNAGTNVAATLGLTAAGPTIANAQLVFKDGKLASQQTISTFNITGSAVAKIPTNDATYTLIPVVTTGKFSGTFTPVWASPLTAATTEPAYNGILLQKGAVGGYGYFLSNALGDTAPQGGSVKLEKK